MPPPYDKRLVFERTTRGADVLAERPMALEPAARRILLVIDGKRCIGELPPFTRAGELEPALETLEREGLIALAGIARAPSAEEQAARARREQAALAQLKLLLQASFERELGAHGVVIAERIRDCVSIEVLRRVLRDGLDVVARERGEAAVRRTVARIKPILDAQRGL